MYKIYVLNICVYIHMYVCILQNVAGRAARTGVAAGARRCYCYCRCRRITNLLIDVAAY